MAFPSDDNKPMSNGQKNTQQELWRFDKRIDSEPDNCAKIIEILLVQLETFGWSNRDSFGIHMAMEEAILNAIRHGNQCDPEKQVHVQIELCHERFYSQVTDQGAGFRLCDVPDPTLEENLDNTCGRGVMLIKNFVDRVQYNEAGNSVELVKTRSK